MQSEMEFGEYTFIVTSNFKHDNAPTVQEIMEVIVQDRIVHRLERNDNKS
jgi:hypothetical protein